MAELLKEIAGAVYRFATNRILWLFALLVILFYVLLVRLFDLQIVAQQETYVPSLPRTKEATISVAAVRGSIFDRNGRPLAINRLAYVVKFDPSVAITNEGLYQLEKLLVKNGEKYVDDFPMTMEEPYEFTLYENPRREFRWKDDMAVPDPENATAEEAFLYLREYFKIDGELSNAEARKILNFRCMIFMERMIYMEDYDPKPVTLAYGVKPETVAAIEEDSVLFAGVYVEVQALREYPQTKYFSHMLGYIGKISEDDYANNKEKGYSRDDIIGRSGLERSFESYLRGTAGSETFIVNSAGRKIETV
ncbi:MAG: hypothetical protein FWF03_07430, partial [Defluviitaleaceae bacterium]|nr:hypothetical protein [Defluviitaleaceae bacterium]